MSYLAGRIKQAFFFSSYGFRSSSRLFGSARSLVAIGAEAGWSCRVQISTVGFGFAQIPLESRDSIPAFPSGVCVKTDWDFQPWMATSLEGWKRLNSKPVRRGMGSIRLFYLDAPTVTKVLFGATTTLMGTWRGT